LLRSLKTVAVSCAEVVSRRVALEGWVVTMMAGTVMVAEDVAAGSATEIAVTVTCKLLAGGPGAVYVVATPLSVESGETLPQGAAEQVTVQMAPLLLTSLTSVATNCVVPVARTVAVEGATVIATDGIVIVAAADFVLSVTDVAVSVTVRSLTDGLFGAV